MNKTKLIALVLSLALLLTGCGMVDFGGYFNAVSSLLGGESIVPYESMEYTRPEVDTVLAAKDAAICTAEAGNDVEAVMNAVYTFYDEYDWFYTCYSLADLRYCHDLTDIYWEKEYNYCAENTAAVDAALEELYYGLAASPLREELEAPEYFGDGFFDSYEGENLWDDTFTALLEQEEALISRYYDLSSQALDHVPGTEEYYDLFADDMAQLLVELIALRQEMAAFWGYGDFTAYAGDFYYSRDYTPQEMADYLASIQQELVPLYCRITDEDWAASYDYSSEADTLDFLRTAAENMGGTMLDAFRLMEDAQLYDIAYGENKFNSSFEVYLTSYYEPFLFLNPTLSRYDCLTLAHEFGHFCNDYACYGSYSGLEVTEIFSQGMEYLALCYGEDTEDLARLKMADSLSVYVEQAAFASFEQRMYTLTGEDLTVENLYALYDEIAAAYGFDTPGYDPREFISITHFYTNPLYVISYVVSNDAAMQIYQLELEDPGAGLALMEESLYTQQYYFQDFLQEAGLENPFTQEQLQKAKAVFSEHFSE